MQPVPIAGKHVTGAKRGKLCNRLPSAGKHATGTKLKIGQSMPSAERALEQVTLCCVWLPICCSRTLHEFSKAQQMHIYLTVIRKTLE